MRLLFNFYFTELPENEPVSSEQIPTTPKIASPSGLFYAALFI